jgi:DNA polymerase elongation subunit (family B)
MQDFFLYVENIGGKIYETRKTARGNVCLKHDFQPEIYFRTEADGGFSGFEQTDLEPFSGSGRLLKKTFESVYDFRTFVRGIDGSFSAGNVFGSKSPVQQFIYQKYHGLKLEDIDLKSLRTMFFDIEILSRDENNRDAGFPDAEKADYPINALCCLDSGVFSLFSLADWKSEDSIHEYRDDIRYHKFRTEKQLLEAFLRHYREDVPDILCGYNSKTFDIPYLVNRLRRYGLHRKLSPFGEVRERTVKSAWGKSQSYDIVGVALLDYMDLVIKYYVEPIESHALDYVGDFFLGLKKLDYEGSLNDLFFDKPQVFNDYNIRDVQILRDLDETLGYINLTAGIAYTAKVNLLDTLSPVRTWDSLIYNRCMDRGICPKIKFKTEQQQTFTGAYVHAKPGILKQILSLDFTSLYPSIIRSLNLGPDALFQKEIEEYHKKKLLEICREDDWELANLLEDDSKENVVDYFLEHEKFPERFVAYLKSNRLSFTISKDVFDVSRKSVFAELMDEIFLTRKEHKNIAKEAKKLLKSDPDNRELQIRKSVYDVSQGSLKVMLNSAYGACANVYFTYNDMRIVKSITATAQLCVRLAAKAVNRYICNVLKIKEKDFCVISDTDSTYFELEELTSKFLGKDSTVTQRTDFIEKFAGRIEEKALEPAFNNLSECMNFYQNVISMKREIICPGYGSNKASGLCTAMKHYACWVQDEEGFRYDEGKEKEKIVGLFSKQKACLKFIKPVFNRTMKLLVTESPDKAREYIKEFETDFFAEKSISRVAYATSVSNVSKFTDPKTKLPVEGEWYDAAYDKLRNGSVPEHSRASINYNWLLSKLSLNNKYEQIRDGDKIRVLYFKENKYGFSVVAFKDTFPKEFGLEDYIDYDKHFQKLFKKPMNDVFLAVVNEEIDKKPSLERIF